MNLGLALTMAGVPTRVKQGGSPSWEDPLASLSGVVFRAETYRYDGVLQDYWLGAGGVPIVDDGVSTGGIPCFGSNNPLVASHWERVNPSYGTLLLKRADSRVGLMVHQHASRGLAWASTLPVTATALTCVVRHGELSTLNYDGAALLGFAGADKATWGAHVKLTRSAETTFSAALMYGDSELFKLNSTTLDGLLRVYSVTVDPATSEVRGFIDGTQVADALVVTDLESFEGYLMANYKAGYTHQANVNALMAYDHTDRVAVEGYYAQLRDLALA